MVWGALIGAGASLIGNAWDRDERSDQAGLTRQFNRELEDLRYNRALEWRNRERAEERQDLERDDAIRHHAYTREDAWQGKAYNLAYQQLMGNWALAREDRQRQAYEFERLLQERQNFIRTRVADAKAAGLHPLFALGATSASGSPGGMGALPAVSYQPGVSSASGSRRSRSGIPDFGGPFEGQSPTGSFLGRGLAASVASLMDFERSRMRDRREQEMHDATLKEIKSRVELNEEEADAVHSRVKREEQAGIRTIAPGTVAAGLAGRPTEQMPRQSIPEYIEVVGPNGRRMIRNPALGDEISQIEQVVRPWADQVDNLYNRASMVYRRSANKAWTWLRKQGVGR